MRSRAIAHPARHAFLRAMQPPMPNLIDAALALAWEEQGIDRRDHVYALLASMCQELDARISPTLTPLDRLMTLNHYLFDELGFKGNEDEYYAITNSYLDYVVVHRTGLPIILSIIYIHLAQHVGVTCYGVAFPGHFMVQARQAHGDPIIIDPFRAGKRWSMSECANYLQRQRVSNDVHDWLAIPTAHDIMVRILRNIKGSHIMRGNFDQAAAALERMLQINHAESIDIRDYGLILGRLGYYAQAVAYLERYAAMAPNAPDIESVRHHAQTILRTAPKLN
jgi:regulator of sirC expression with transglutaminase-like and TPR domain